jgi:hypothetical protein
MSDIYCGALDKVPANKRRGSMRECAEKKQISYWGLHKADKKIIDSIKKNKKDTADTKNKLFPLLVKYRTRVKKLKEKLEGKEGKDADNRKELKKEIDKWTKEMQIISNKLTKLEKEASEKSTKKGSQKRITKKMTTKLSKRKSLKRSSKKLSKRKSLKRLSKKLSKRKSLKRSSKKLTKKISKRKN